jgi:VanZ family protein
MMVVFFMPPSFFKNNPITVPLIPCFDKFIHVVLYVVFGFLLARYIWHRVSQNNKNIFIRVLFWALILGLIIELIQGLEIIGRSFEWFDIVANVFGAILGTFVYLKYTKIRVRIIK